MYGQGSEFVETYDIFGDKARLKNKAHEKGVYTPQMAVRYLQHQINDMCLAARKESNLNE